ncbi:MAG: pilus assembly protein PilM [Phycisphaerae bacterium]
MAHLKKRTLLPMGIHVTPEAAHVVQFEQAGDELELVSEASCSFTSPQDAVARLVSAETPQGMDADEPDYAPALRFLRQELGWNHFKGKDAVVSLPTDRVAVQHVRMPPMQPDELAASLPYELEDKLPFPPSQAVVRHIVAGSVAENSETKQDVLVLAVPRQVVQSHVAAVARLKLNVVGAGIEPCSMCYGYAYASEHSGPSQSGPPCLMIVYLGWERSHVAILRGQETMFVKPVAKGLDHVTQAVAAVTEASLEEASEQVAAWREGGTAEAVDEAVTTYNRCREPVGHLTDEIQSCMRYHASLARGAQIDRLVFVGPGARDKALVRVLSANLSVACEIGDPIGTATGSPDPANARPEMAVAVGLSLFGAS